MKRSTLARTATEARNIMAQEPELTEPRTPVLLAVLTETALREHIGSVRASLDLGGLQVQNCEKGAHLAERRVPHEAKRY